MPTASTQPSTQAVHFAVAMQARGLLDSTVLLARPRAPSSPPFSGREDPEEPHALEVANSIARFIAGPSGRLRDETVSAVAPGDSQQPAGCTTRDAAFPQQCAAVKSFREWPDMANMVSGTERYLHSAYVLAAMAIATPCLRSDRFKTISATSQPSDGYLEA